LHPLSHHDSLFVSDRLFKLEGDVYQAVNEHVQHWASTGGVTQQLNISAEALVKIIAEGSGGSSNERQETEDMNICLRAYWKVAKKRFIDKVQQLLNTHFLSKVCKNLKTSLMPRLLEKASVLFQESPSRITNRAALKDKLARLLEAQKLLRKHIHEVM
jgi:hypothetical protein